MSCDIVVVLMIRRPPASTRTATRFPSPTLFRSRPLRREALAQQIEAARRYRADAGEQLQQLALAVAGNAGNANDLPAAHAEADVVDPGDAGAVDERSEEHTSELQSLMRISYAVFCLKKKKRAHNTHHNTHY